MSSRESADLIPPPAGMDTLHARSAPSLEKEQAGVRLNGRFWTACLCALLLTFLYAPTVYSTGYRAYRYEQYQQNLLILPVVIVLLWLRRTEIKAARPFPVLWGMLPMCMGVCLQILSQRFHSVFTGMLSLLPVLAGIILLLHGPELWRIVRFPVLFLGFAANLPSFLLDPLSHRIQNLSTIGTAWLMQTLGFPLLQRGNILSVPGMALEVAEACSGFHKLTAMLIYAILLGEIHSHRPVRRLLMVLLTVPLALLANIMRLAILVAAAEWGGPKWEATVHYPAELVVLVLAGLLMWRFSSKLAGNAAKVRSGDRPLIKPADNSNCPSEAIDPSSFRSIANETICRQKGIYRRKELLCSLTAFLLLFSALFANARQDRKSADLQPAPEAAAFPLQVAGWKCSKERPFAPAIQRISPTATMIDRLYSDHNNHTVELMIVSAKLPEDIHDPEQCLFGQHWIKTNSQSLSLDGKSAQILTVSYENSANLSVLYWKDNIDSESNSGFSYLARLRDDLNGRGTILIRLTAPASENSDRTLQKFAQDVLPVVKEWKNQSGRSAEK